MSQRHASPANGRETPSYHAPQDVLTVRRSRHIHTTNMPRTSQVLKTRRYVVHRRLPKPRCCVSNACGVGSKRCVRMCVRRRSAVRVRVRRGVAHVFMIYETSVQQVLSRGPISTKNDPRQAETVPLGRYSARRPTRSAAGTERYRAYTGRHVSWQKNATGLMRSSYRRAREIREPRQ